MASAETRGWDSSRSAEARGFWAGAAGWYRSDLHAHCDCTVRGQAGLEGVTSLLEHFHVCFFLFLILFSFSVHSYSSVGQVRSISVLPVCSVQFPP